MNILIIPRAVWGSTSTTEKFIADRYSALPAEKTTIQIHHTASIDNDDATPNRWDYLEARDYMRSLQWARPELGPLPYSENVAVSEDLSLAWIFEGRGILKVGAHTAGHNRDGVGWGVFGNFDKPDPDAAAAALEAIRFRAWTLKQDLLPNLGTVLNPHGWEAWGHRDSSTKSCPGNYLYPLLEGFTLEDEMTPQERLELISDITSAVESRLLTPRAGQEHPELARSAARATLGTLWTEEGLDNPSMGQLIARGYKNTVSIRAAIGEIELLEAEEVAAAISDKFAAQLLDALRARLEE